MKPSALRFRTGAALAVLYAVVVVVTSLATGQPVRPLYDGVGGAQPYKWVNPPWYAASTNIKPDANSHEIPFENGVSPLIGVNSADAQFILNLPEGALPAREGDTAVRVSFTPVDPKKLAEPPGEARSNGNAYRVEMTYQPSGTPLETTTISGNVIMIVPDEAEKLLFSLDGKSWDELPTQRLGDPTTVGSAFNKPGYYLVGTLLPEFPNPNQEDGTKKTIGTVMIVVAVALLLGYVLPTVVRRSRAAQAEAEVRTRRTRVHRRR